jgi:pimeloyl-ACP methyl ester carboxylesterase
VAGHSLGAAVATHAAAYLLNSKIAVSELYTFGSPRVGDPKFAEWFSQAFGAQRFKARVTHKRDPVPHLPNLDWGFQHIGTEVFYKGSLKEGGRVCSDGGSEDKSCSDQYWVDLDVTDHLSYFDLDFTGTILTCQK